MIQRRGRVVKDYKSRQTVCLVHYNQYPIVKLAPKSMGQVISTLFKLQGIILTNQGGPGNFEIEYLLNSKELNNFFKFFLSIL